MSARGILATVVLLAAGGAGYIRFAPSDPALWHVSPPEALFRDLPSDRVQALEGAAVLRISSQRGGTEDLLARLDAIALATARTTRLAGSPATDRITWITRSALWGFPDYTTAEAHPDGLRLYARLRFGRSDFGVNAARLTDWLSRL
ncbi:DUF1499 domain-containing protein [Neotabrizicola sp. sgz301269]|uniref:DUF1499 domain-containing protein n=1 Tax=Neotabrizicola sp. sgz301269 TaxID=3276282 RepID=UPI0037701945